MGDNGSTASAAARAGSPYIGLSYYTEADAEWFFGRGDECQTIIGNLRAARLTVLYASSGVGKSSLLRAGVARQCRELAQHQLAERGAAGYVPIVFGAWRDDPVEDLIGAIESAVQPLLPAGTSVQLPREELAAAIKTAAAAVGAELLIILDQFEEYLLYRTREPAGRRLADELAACVNNPQLRANFLIAIREDAYAGLGDLFAGKIRNIFGNYLQLEYLDRDAARETIVKPIEHFNQLHAEEPPIEIEPQLVEAVLDQVRSDELHDDDSAPGPVEPGDGARAHREEIVTPYLQLVMSSLWAHERQQGSHVLRLATLTELGGAREVMRTHLDGALGALSKEEYDTALDLFHYLVTPSGTKIAFAASDLAELVERPYEQVADLLAKLASEDTRILRHVPPPAGRSQPADRYELFHDVLAPAIVKWRQRALEQRKRAEGERERERLEREKHEAEERTREEARRRRAFQRLAVGAVALLVVAVVLGVIALLAQRRAASNLEAAQASKLVASAEQTLPGDPELSTQLALRALHLKRTPQAEAALREAVPQLHELKTLSVGSAVNAAAFGRGGSRVVTAGENGTAIIWDAANGARLRELPAHDGPVNGAAFSPNGSEVVAAYKDGTAIVWDAANGARLRELPAHDGPVNGAAFSPNGTEVVTANKDGRAIIWNAETGARLRELPGPAGSMESAAFSPNGSEVVTASENSAAMIWDAENGQPLMPLEVPVGSVESVAFSPDGKDVVTAEEDGTAIVWNAESGKQVVSLDTPEGGTVLGASFSPDGDEVVTADQDRTATLWDLATGKPLMALGGDEGPVRAATFSSSGGEVLTASEDGTARIWEAQPHQLLRVLRGDHGIVDDAAFSPDGKEVVTANQEHSASIWNVESGKQMLLSGAKGPIYTAAFSRDGKRVVTASENGTAIIWDAEDGKPLHELPVHAGAVNDAAFSPDGTKVVTASKDGSAIIWDAENGQRLMPLRVPPQSVESAAFSPDGTKVVTTSENGTASIWDAASGKRLALLPVSEVAVLDAAFSPDGTEVVTASKNGTASIWGVDGHKLPPVLRPDGGPIYAAAFSPVGNEIVTASEDGEVAVWDARSGTRLTVLSSHEGVVLGAAFNRYGTEVVTANEGGTAAIWSTELSDPLKSLERIAEQRVTHELTRQERDTYLDE
jgi:WD40 repeat protein